MEKNQCELHYKQRKIHIDDETWEKTRRVSKACGYSISNYIRTLLNLEQPRPIPPAELRQIYIELSRIGNNINQMAKLSNTRGSADYSDFSGYRDEILKLQEKIFEECAKPRRMIDGDNSDKTNI